MGLFGKKKTEPCPVCGREMDSGILSNSKAVADGIICHDCELMLRGKFDIETIVEFGFFDINDIKEKRHDPLRHMTVGQIKSLIEKLRETQAKAVADFGGTYRSFLTAEEVFMITPKATEDGLKRAKELKNKLVVRGLVQSGSFCKGDAAVIVHDGNETPVIVLDVIPCEGVVDFKTSLQSNMHKKEAAADTNAWLILDVSSGVKNGDLIAIR